MSNQRDSGLEKHWRRVIRGCESSGQSIRAYCRGMGLSEASYHFWRREILLRERETAKEESPRFVPVRVVAPAGFQVRVECSSGHLVTLAGADAEILRGLFGALKGESAC